MAVASGVAGTAGAGSEFRMFNGFYPIPFPPDVNRAVAGEARASTGRGARSTV